MSVDVDIACGSGSQVLLAPDQLPPRLTVTHQLEAIQGVWQSLGRRLVLFQAVAWSWSDSNLVNTDGLLTSMLLLVCSCPLLFLPTPFDRFDRLVKL